MSYEHKRLSNNIIYCHPKDTKCKRMILDSLFDSLLAFYFTV